LIRHDRAPLRHRTPTRIFGPAAARDRLKVLLAHERAVATQSKLVEALREEILTVIAKHVAVERDRVQVKIDRSLTSSTLAIEIELPAPSAPRLAA
jgi:cell division topological specificity factor